METKSFKVNIDRSNSTIAIDFDGVNETLNYSADIDFTLLVEKMCVKIEDQVIFSYDLENNTEDLNSKELLICETLKDIVNSYNGSFEIIKDESEEL